MLSPMSSHNIRGALPVGAPSASMFPHRTSCRWIQQSEELSARFCNDGTVTMWRDVYGNVWLADEKPPKRWRKTMSFYKKHPSAISFGAAAGPTKAVGRLQAALEQLSRRVDDHQVATTLDGRMGPLTASATNVALQRYAVTAPLTLRTGHLTQSQILGQIVPITAYIEAVKSIPAKVTSGVYRPGNQPSSFLSQLLPAATSSAASSSQQPAYAPGGASAMPAPGYYPPPPGYAPAYAPTYYSRGPGGLPTDRASFDVKAFIPAQYEHVNFSGAGLAALALGGVVVFMLVKQRRGEKGK